MMNEKELIRSEKAVPIIPIIILCLGVFLLILAFTGALGSDRFHNYSPEWVLISAIIIAFGVVSLIIFGNCSLVVTDKRVYGNALFKRVDIPIDSISAVAIVGIINGISVASSSGYIRFAYIKNSITVHQEISKLILNRQDKPAARQTNIINQSSDADEILKFKKLLDDGVITQEEFDDKKRKLLNK